MQYCADTWREYTGSVGTGAVAVGALLGAIAGAVLGAYVQKGWPSEPTDEGEFRRRLAKLEAEIKELEFRLRSERKFKRGPESVPTAQRAQSSAPSRPFLEVRGEPPGQQYLVLNADRDFRLSRIDYVSNQGTTVISEDIGKSGSRIEVPINEKKVSRVWYLRQNVNATPTQLQFRSHLSVDERGNTIGCSCGDSATVYVDWSRADAFPKGFSDPIVACLRY
jgi:hypothetical protein